MKIIEALKELKELRRKTEDLRRKIGLHCADMDVENAVYPDQRGQVDAWLQAHKDLVARIEQLTLMVHRTNLETSVSIEIGGNLITKPIAAWILRRSELANMEKTAWSQLSDRGLSQAFLKQTNGEQREVNVRRYYDPKQRDEKVEVFTAEPSLIDSKLEVVNAITDLI